MDMKLQKSSNSTVREVTHMQNTRRHRGVRLSKIWLLHLVNNTTLSMPPNWMCIFFTN